VAADNPRTIVVIEAGAPVTMPWLPHVGAVLLAWFPGVEGGAAIGELLFGYASPGGRLPVTLLGARDPMPIEFESPVPSAQLTANWAAALSSTPAATS